MDITKIEEIMESYANELMHRYNEVSFDFREEARKNNVASDISMLGLSRFNYSEGVGVVDGEFGFVELGYECSFNSGMSDNARWIIGNDWKEVAKEKIASSIEALVKNKKQKEKSEIEKALDTLKKYGIDKVTAKLGENDADGKLTNELLRLLID